MLHRLVAHRSPVGRGPLSRLLRFAVVPAMFASVAAPAIAAGPTPPVSATHDTFVEFGTDAAIIFGADQDLIVKMGDRNGDTSRAIYLQFTYDPAYVWM